MLKIRLKRMGRKNRPLYRLVVAETHCSPAGKFIEVLGNFNPRNKGKSLVLKEERIKYWLHQGAGTSPVVHNLLVDRKIITGPKKKATRRRKNQKEQAEKTEQPAETKKVEKKYVQS